MIDQTDMYSEGELIIRADELAGLVNDVLQTYQDISHKAVALKVADIVCDGMSGWRVHDLRRRVHGRVFGLIESKAA